MRLVGLAAAPGTAVGPVWRHLQGVVAGQPLPDVRAAADRAAAELEALAARVRELGHNDEAAIFSAQALMALDPVLLDEAEARTRTLGTADADTLAEAVEAVARAAAESIASLPDEVLAARAADLRDVGARIARIVSGRHIRPPERPAIAVADDLPPSVTAELPAGMLLGIALERGSQTSHAAILARGLGIPAVVGVPGLLEALGAGGDDAPAVTCALDGRTGEVFLEPTADELDLLATRERAARTASARSQATRGQPGRTADGRAVLLSANIGRPADAVRALEAGAEGVGLFRTEFMFAGRSDAPTEDEQVAAYADVLRALGPDRPVVIRLLDIGGDKPLSYLHLETEANPFLGVRGLRIAYTDDALYRRQLRAIARAGAVAGVIPHVMAPMVARFEDVELLRSLVDSVERDLDADGVPRSPRLVVGVMVEVPSAALLAGALASHVDFFSIGSNDLTQYVLAMDRTHPALATVADALHPSVLHAVRATIEGAARAGIPVAVCGELAGDPAGALVLVGLGVDELSMDAGSLDEVRLALRGRTTRELRTLARRALRARTAPEVRALAGALLRAPAAEVALEATA